jgi:hypothetical protein
MGSTDFFWLSLLTFSLLTTAFASDTVNFAAYAPSPAFSIAQELGFFNHYNVSINYTQIVSAADAYQQLLDGTLDIVAGTFDDVLDFRMNRGMFLAVLGQVDAGPGLALVGSPDVTQIEQLRDGFVMVDNTASGYSYATQEILSQNGLNATAGDYTFEV